MFNFRGFVKTIGVALIITIVFSFLVGLFNLLSVEWLIFSTFLVSYGSIGILAPLWNKHAPYFATYLSAIVLSVMNILFSIIVLRIPVYFAPDVINENLLSGALLSLFIAYLFIQINNRIGRKKYD